MANYLDTISKDDGWRRKPSGVLAVDKIVNFVSNDKWSAGAVNNLFFTYFFNTDDFRLAKNVDITVLLAEKNDNGYLFSDALLTSFHASAAFNLHTSRLNGMNYYSMADDGPGLFSFLWGVLQNVSREVSGFAEAARRLEKEDINSDGYETDSESGFAIITRDTSPAPSIWN